MTTNRTGRASARQRLGYAFVLAVLSGCGTDRGPVPRTPDFHPPPRVPEPEILEYQPDPDAWGTRTIRIGDTTALLSNRVRALYVKGKLPRVLPPIVASGMREVPKPLGGGIVYWGRNIVAVAPSLADEPRGLRTFRDHVSTVSFHPEGFLVTTSGGRRVLVDAKTGTPKPLRPVGLESVALADDGRAVAVLAAGDASMSVDGGATWKPLAVPGVVERVNVIDSDGGPQEIELRLDRSANLFAPRGELGLRESAPLGYLVGRPSNPQKLGLEPGWLETTTPLGMAVRRGIPAPGGIALVPSHGNLYSVSLVDGTIRGVTRSVFAPGIDCDSVWVKPRSAPKDFQPVDQPRSPFDPPAAPAKTETADEPLLLCGAHDGAAIVIAGALGTPAIEKTLSSGGSFYAADDGALAYVAKVDKPAPDDQPLKAKTMRELANARTVWHRTSGGSWVQLDVAEVLAAADKVLGIEHKPAAAAQAFLAQPAGKRPPPRPPPKKPVPVPAAEDDAGLEFLRPLPSQGGLALVARHKDRLYAVDSAGKAPKEVALGDLKTAEIATLMTRLKANDGRVDRSVSRVSGGSIVVVGAPHHGFEIPAEGPARLTAWHYKQVSFHGARGFARSDERVFQTLDRGLHWTEVAAPPDNDGDLSCGSVGCRVGSFLRLGWRATPPVEAKKKNDPTITAPPEGLATLPLLSCTIDGKAVTKSLAPTPDADAPRPRRGSGIGSLDVVSGASARHHRHRHRPEPEARPDKLPGLGANQITGLGTDGGEAAVFSRSNEWADAESSDVWAFMGAGLPHFADDGTFKVDAKLDRRVMVVEPFDPAAPIRTSTIKYASLAAVHKDRGGAQDIPFPVQGATVVPVAPWLGGKPSSIATFWTLPTNDGWGGAPVALVGGGKEAIVAWDPTAIGQAKSAVARANDTLVLRNDGALARITSVGAQRLLSVPQSVLSDTDVLAVSPDGSVSLVRMHGTDAAPGEDDPALLIPIAGADGKALPLQTSRAVVLASWSTLTPASDAACKDDKAGARFILSSPTPWLRWNERDLAAEGAGMRLLVRWSAARVCLEGAELALTQTDGRGADVLVVRFADGIKGSNASIVRATLGLESRHPRTCTLSKK